MKLNFGFNFKKSQNILMTVCSVILVIVISFSSYLMYRMESSGVDTVLPEESYQPSSDIFEALVSDVKPLKTPINVLLLCGDQSSGNTDTIIVAHYDPVTCDISMISIPRDTAHIMDKIRKINFAYPSGGMDKAVSCISKLLGVNLDYYCYVNTKIFRQIVDILDGVYITVKVPMDYDDKSQDLHIHLKPGRYLMDGKTAEGYVRFRKPNGSFTPTILKEYDGGDLKRINAQQTFIKELIKQKVSIEYFPKVNDVLKEIFENVNTNMSLNTAMRLLYNVKDINIKKVKTYTINGSTGMFGGLSYVFYNGQLVNTTKKKVKYVDAAEIIDKEFSSTGMIAKASQSDAQYARNAVNSVRGYSSSSSSTSSSASNSSSSSSGSSSSSAQKPKKTDPPKPKETKAPKPKKTAPPEEPVQPTQVPQVPVNPDTDNNENAGNN